MTKERSKAGEYGILVVGGLAAIYILSMKVPSGDGSKKESLIERTTYDVTKTAIIDVGDAAGGVGSAVVGGFDIYRFLLGDTSVKPPGTTEPVTVSISDPRLNLDFSKTSQSKVPDLSATKKDMLTGNSINLPESQPVVAQIQQQLKPGQGYIFTAEEQAQFLDPYGDLLFEQYASKKQPAKGSWFS